MKKESPFRRNININEYNDFSQPNANNFYPRVNTEVNNINNTNSKKLFKNIILFELKEENEKLKEQLEILLKEKNIENNIMLLNYQNSKLKEKCLNYEQIIINLKNDLEDFLQKNKILEKIIVDENFKKNKLTFDIKEKNKIIEKLNYEILELKNKLNIKDSIIKEFVNQHKDNYIKSVEKNGKLKAMNEKKISGNIDNMINIKTNYNNINSNMNEVISQDNTTNSTRINNKIFNFGKNNFNYQ